ncbi:unnamed protein product [Caenorhabditis angaria]|uniref:Uncharacterized protein n=1 Tax=Caenorhabditis angaria TaxID=860376 RepID=A0A9P1ITJ6_9PELO|nr:unnamed protein product [Caenorhabditis angaria]
MNKNKKTSRSNETRKSSNFSNSNETKKPNRRSDSKIDSDSSKSYRRADVVKTISRKPNAIQRSPEKPKRSGGKTSEPSWNTHNKKSQNSDNAKEFDFMKRTGHSPIMAKEEPVANMILLKNENNNNNKQMVELPPQRESHRSLIGLDGESDLDTDDNSPRPSEKHLVKKTSPALSSPHKSSSVETQDDSFSLAENEKGLSKYKSLFKEYAAKSQQINIDEITEDFQDLPSLQDECTTFYNSVNSRKNRYKDIPCLEVSRVKLHFMGNPKEPGSDYIHANYVTSKYLRTKYILTQGPKKNTVVDFWRMVWQEKTAAIVMLCQFIEHGREKCTEYFPNDHKSKLRFDRLELSYIDSTRDRMVLTTKLKLEYKGESRTVTHYQWMEWPDYQVPGSTEIMLRLLRKIRGKKFPSVIHCAAGVGRSGTFVAIEIALMMIHNHFELPDIKKIVAHIRSTGRCAAVQTLQQYLLIRKVVLDFGVSNRLITEESFDRYSAAYHRALRQQNTS